MEKSSVVKPKNRLLKLAASAVPFQNPPFSPNREKRSTDHNRKGFSGPIISIIPAEARYKSRSSSFVAHEPTSPKISCMGQIKHKKKMCNLNKHNQKSLPPRDHQFVSHSTPLEQVNVTTKSKVLKSTQSFSQVKNTNKARVLKSVQSFDDKKKEKNFAIKNIFTKPATKKSDHDSVDKAPNLGQMQRFSSGRNSLSNFNWTTAQITPIKHDEDRNCYSDEERKDDELDDCKIAFSAPILIGGGKRIELEPKKEINLWKRRTMAQPKPLQVNTTTI